MVKRIISNGTGMLFSQQTGILSAAAIIAATLLASRVLGLLKYRLLTSYFSVAEIGIFLAAFRLPNLIFDLIVMGALTTAFIPVFAGALGKDSAEANRVASTVINLTLGLFLPVLVIFLLFTREIMAWLVPGLTVAELNQLIPLTRIMLLGQVPFLVLGNFFTGIVQSHRRFLIPALAPLFYNLGVIGGTLSFASSHGLWAPVIGTIFGAVLFCLVQIPLAFRLGYRYQPALNWRHPAVREIGRLALPRFFGLLVSQVNYTINLALSSLLSARSITIFNFAQQLQQLPIALFGATIAQAALPTLSEEHHHQDLSSFKKTFVRSFMQILFLTLPAAAVLIVLRIPVVRLVYGASKFDWNATVETGRTLAFFSLALVAEALINLLVRAFFALRESRLPTVITTLTVLLNIGLSFLFIVGLQFPVWGLAAAAAAADIVYGTVLLLFLNEKIKFLQFSEFILPAGKMVVCAVITTFSLYIPMKLLDQLVFDTTRTVPLIWLTGVAGLCGLTVYLFLTWVADIDELKEFLGILGKIRLFFQKKATLPVTEAAATVTETTKELT